MKDSMKKLTLVRYESSDNGTFGFLVFDSNRPLHTLEEPWKNNQRNISCIPEGTYVVKKREDSKWQIMDVPNRSGILIHVGNTLEDIEGCILVGLNRGYLGEVSAVLMSKPAYRLFDHSLRHHDEFELTIIKGY